MVKLFKDFMKEHYAYMNAMLPTIEASRSLDNTPYKEMINSALAKVTSLPFATPYIAMGAISKVLAYANIILPKYVFLKRKNGTIIFKAEHFGHVSGIDTLGQIHAHTTNPIDPTIPIRVDTERELHVVFHWNQLSNGFYDVDVSLVNNEELEEIASILEEIEEEHLEEGTNIQELSKNTLRSYVDKAENDYIKHRGAQRRMNNLLKRYPDDEAGKKGLKKANRKAFNRDEGIIKANKKLENEESLNELSKETLGRYIKSASRDKASLHTKTLKSGERGDIKNFEKGVQKISKRTKGIDQAVDKVITK